MGGWRTYHVVLVVVLVFVCIGSVVSSSLSSSTYDGETQFFEVSGGRLSADYVDDSRKYTVSFRANPKDHCVEFKAYDTALRLKPIGLKCKNASINPVYSLHPAGEDKVVYKDMFGEGVDVLYELQESQLKESIIISSRDSLPAGMLSGSTVSIEFKLMYPDYVAPSLDGKNEWRGIEATTRGDINFIRRKKPQRLYVVERFYRIEKPYLVDQSGQMVDLSYTLSERGGETYLSVNFPRGLQDYSYPVVVDPTVELVKNKHHVIEVELQKNCSSSYQNCDKIEEDPEDLWFSVEEECSQNDANNYPVQKVLFQFNITGLHDYDGSLDSAILGSRGNCLMESAMPSNHEIYIDHVSGFTSQDNCSSHPDNQVIQNYIRKVMEKDDCPGSSQGDDNVKTILQDRLDAGDNYFAFKLDIHPTLGDMESPASDYSFELYQSSLELEYQFTCTNSNDCPTTEYCEETGSTDLCEPDLSYGDYCENLAVDDDDHACQNDNCQADDFDNNGKYCTETGKCVHNGTRYNDGTVHCINSTSYKTCTTGRWSTSTNCQQGYECTDPNGCQATQPDLEAKSSNFRIYLTK